ncbi:MAG: hypothetical protein HZC42_13915 [Candidatus Eisenbacteria bacterium]|nr:hypothetical protein [Candidatus Eisenbacteria bacterium]
MAAVLLLGASLPLSLPAAAEANWIPNGVSVSDTCPGCGGESQVIPDSQGGAFVAWRDFRNLNDVDIYAQRVTGSGAIAPGWPASGLRAAGRGFDDFLLGLAPDGQGGGFLVIDSTLPPTGIDVLLQHVRSDGLIAPGWPSDGLIVAGSINDEREARICADGAGGAYVVYERYSGSTPDVRAARITSDGQFAAGWPAPGRVFCEFPGYKSIPLAVADDSGGVMVTWVDGRNLSQTRADIYALRRTRDGAVAPGWPAAGLPVCTAANTQTYPVACSDGAGGAFAAWSDFRNVPPDQPYGDDIYLAHIRPDGGFPAGWPADGLPVAVVNGTQQPMDLVADGQGGVLVAWEDSRGSGLYLQRVQADGTPAPGWPVNGTPVSTLYDYLYDPRIAPDGQGGVYVAFSAYNSIKVYVQHLTAGGQVAPGWPAEGLPVADVVYPNQQHPRICTDGQGGAIVVWSEVRNGKGSAYAQRYVVDGPVAVALALVSAEAEPEAVRLTWYAAASNQDEATVYRRTMQSEWERAGTVLRDGEGYLRFEDRTVAAGTRYGYRLVLGSGGSASFSTETWIEVPAGYRFALAGLRPNPSSGSDLKVGFTLARAERAALELFDATGRRVLAREVGALGPGHHVFALSQGARVEPGVYWLRLTQGRESAAARAVVIR